MRVHRLPDGKRMCSFSNRQIQVEFLFYVVVIVPFEDKAVLKRRGGLMLKREKFCKKL